MTETTLALCQKPALGIAMWLASLCVTNQALHDAYIDLGQRNNTLHQEIKAPMKNERYMLSIYLQNKAKNSLTTNAQKNWSEIICPSKSSDGITGTAVSDGKKGSMFSLTHEIKTLQGQLVTKEKLSPDCPRPESEDGHILNLGAVDIKKGKYIVSITNEQPISVPNSQQPLVLLHGTSAGFP
jgi:hypothetical protein